MTRRRRVVVTGAGGFVGAHLVERFARDGWDVVALVRPNGSALRPRETVRIVETDLARPDALLGVLRAGDVVVHLAGRAHVMHERASDPLAVFRAANVAPTEMLCESAARAGVERLVFMSSAKVFGEGRERPYAVTDPVAPADPYAQSKSEAERVVGQSRAQGTFDWTILRPPFVYGPGGKGNFPRLVALARLSTIGSPSTRIHREPAEHRVRRKSRRPDPARRATDGVVATRAAARRCGGRLHARAASRDRRRDRFARAPLPLSARRPPHRGTCDRSVRRDGSAHGKLAARFAAPS